MNPKQTSNGSPIELSKSRLLRTEDALRDLRREADAAHDAYTTGAPRGPISGFKSLDNVLGGAFFPGIHPMHASPGVGKTAFALQVAAQCQCPALFVTCEISPSELLRRHAARVHQQFLGRFKSGEFPGSEVERLVRTALAAAPLLHIVDATRDPFTKTLLEQTVEVVRRDHAHVLVVIDSLHAWAEGAYQGGSEYEILNCAIAELRGSTRRHDYPILLVTERSRGAADTGGQNAGAGTRKIEYGAETVIELSREKPNDDTPDGRGDVAVTVKLSKNRHNSMGKPLPFRFNGALQRFQEGEK